MPVTLIVSLDFELFWGMLDVCPLEKYQANVLGGRKAIPKLLELFQKHGICMHMWAASMTTMTPFGWSVSSMHSIICRVILSCTCSLRANTSTTRGQPKANRLSRPT